LVFHQKEIPYSVVLIRLIEQTKLNLENAIKTIYNEIISQKKDLYHTFFVFDGFNLREREIQ
jgi:hypothetical protein